MDQLFPYANIVVGILVLIVGFLFHWLGQLISVLDWDLAIRLGLQEQAVPAEYKVYEHGIAMADVVVGWVYGIAGLGLVLDAAWGYKLAWVPGVILVYHSASFWFWTGNWKRAGVQLPAYRVPWFLANLITGVLAVMVAWNAG